MAINGASAQTLTGAGSSFINPIMVKWAAAYKAETGVEINYQPIGSGGGINQLIHKQVDFAGSDVPMTADEKSDAGGPVVTIPDIIGAVVVAYNVPGISNGIAFSGSVLADIYLGKITYWDDPAIMKLSPGVKFPHENILVLHRSDGSGTTAIFTEYLSKVSSEWSSQVGTGKSVKWPAGLGGKGSAGIAGYLKNKPYSIGYVELAYAIENNIPYALVKNKAGKSIYPTIAAASAAAEGVKVPANLELSITNTSNPASYPITGVSFLIVREGAPNNPQVKRFVQWVLSKGQTPEYTETLHYAPLPKALQKLGIETIEKVR
jgi:phosphate transport system substrate-binding protein